MPIDVVFPHLSDDVDEGVLVTWFVEPGASVAEGDLIASVQVEKVEQEVYASGAGSVVELLAAPGDVVAQEAVIARIGTPAEASARAPAAATPAGAAGPAVSTPAVGGAPPVIASPAAKRVARELGMDLTAVTGTGPGGRIVEEDVRQAATAVEGATGGDGAGPGEPLGATRRLMASRLHDWLVTTAQFTLTTEVDVTALASQSPAWTAAVVVASARALRRHPSLTRRWQGDRLVTVQTIDVGVAVSLDDGLIVPVVRRADERAMEVIAAEVADLSDRARRGALRVDEVAGGVFTVTSLGAYPIDAFTPLLHPPQLAILGVGRAKEKPAVVGGRIEPRALLVLSLTVDHRVIDGAPAAAFLAEIATLLADPVALASGER